MTRRKEELEAMDTAAITDAIQDKIAEEIDTVVREQRVGRDLCMEDDSLQGNPGNTLTYLQRGTISGQPTAEGQEVDMDRFNEDLGGSGDSYKKEITITARKFSAGSQITREAITDGREDLIDATEEEIGAALSNIEDNVSLGALAGGEFVYQEEPNSGPSGSDMQVSGSDADNTATPVFNVIGVQDTTASPVESVNYTVDSYNDGNLSIASPDSFSSASDYVVTYTTVGGANMTDVNSWGTVDPSEDILNGIRRKIASRKYNPDTMVMNETNLARIMTSDEFIDASKYGEADVLHNAEVGRVFGMRVMISSQIPDKWIIGADVEADPAVFLNKEDVRVLQKEAITSDDVKIVAYQRYGAGIKKADAVELLRVNEN